MHCCGLARVEQVFVLAPDHQQARLFSSALPLVTLGRRAHWLDNREQVTLSLSLAALVEEIELVRPQIWVTAFVNAILSNIPSTCCGQG